MHYKQYKRIVQPNGTMNLTRGCVHGCIYCDSRSKCYQFEHPFTDIEIKANACQMLDDELSRKRKKFMIGTGAMSDPYMNIPEVLTLTRCAFETILKHGYGLTFQTKSTLFLRDLDLLKKIHDDTRLVVQMTLTTFDDALSLKIEPGVATTTERIEALRVLNHHGIPSVVWLSPLLPYINDDLENLKKLLNACKDVGVKGIIWFGSGLTLREGNREYFYQQLDQLFPGLKDIYKDRYGLSYEVPSPNAKSLNQYLVSFCQANNILYQVDEVFAYLRTFKEKKPEQLTLF